jgi:hypothetical protein
MTYGWAIALVVIIAAVLFAMGIFDTSNFVGNRATGFAGASVSNWRLSPEGVMTVQVQNQVGKTITVREISVTISGTTGTNTTNAQNLTVGQTSSAIAITGLPSQGAGSGYTATMNINYSDTASGFAYVSSGTLTGKVA